MVYQRSQIIEHRLDLLLSLIQANKHSTPVLAEQLGVSIPTISRCIRALRERGYPIKSRRTADGWSYRIEE
jgi:biotin operon repressor